jgi:hypothetical protein
MQIKWCPIASVLPAIRGLEDEILWEHVSGCDSCQQKLNIVNHLRDAGVEKSPKTSHCLNRNTLNAYVNNKLPINEASKVREHIRSCSYCTGAASRLLHTATNKGDNREAKLLEEALDLLPLRDISIEYSSSEFDSKIWISLSPYSAYWAVRGTLAAFCITDIRDGFYRVHFGKHLLGILKYPDQYYKAAASTVGTEYGISWQFEHGSYLLLVRFTNNILLCDK